MNTTHANTTTPEERYNSLGFLFYSVAASDGHVKAMETAALKKLIRSRWLPIDDDRDDLGTDAAFYIEFTFDSACDQSMPHEEAFERFRSFYKVHGAGFEPSERQLILDTARAIATATGWTNKAELVRLSVLDHLLREGTIRGSEQRRLSLS